MKAFGIGQFKYVRKIKLTVREARLAGKWMKKKIVALPKAKFRNSGVKSRLKPLVAVILLKKGLRQHRLVRENRKKENLVEKLKDIGQIEVQEGDVNILPTKFCRKCFRKIARLAKDLHAFRHICLKSKQIQGININARTKPVFASTIQPGEEN